MGVYPMSFLNVMDASVEQMIENYDAAIEAYDASTMINIAQVEAE